MRNKIETFDKWNKRQWIIWTSIFGGMLLFVSIWTCIAIGTANNDDKILVEIEWKHHKQVVCLPHDVTKEQIRDVSQSFAHISFPMGNDLHCLVFGQIRIYLLEKWNEHLEGFDIVALDTTAFMSGTRCYVHIQQFLKVIEVTNEKFWEIIGYYQWEYKKDASN